MRSPTVLIKIESDDGYLNEAWLVNREDLPAIKKSLDLLRDRSTIVVANGRVFSSIAEYIIWWQGEYQRTREADITNPEHNI